MTVREAPQGQDPERDALLKRCAQQLMDATRVCQANIDLEIRKRVECVQYILQSLVDLVGGYLQSFNPCAERGWAEIIRVELPLQLTNTAGLVPTILEVAEKCNPIRLVDDVQREWRCLVSAMPSPVPRVPYPSSKLEWSPITRTFSVTMSWLSESGAGQETLAEPQRSSGYMGDGMAEDDI